MIHDTIAMIRAPKAHIKIGILPNMTSGIPLIPGPGSPHRGAPITGDGGGQAGALRPPSCGLTREGEEGDSSFMLLRFRASDSERPEKKQYLDPKSTLKRTAFAGCS